MRIRLEFIRFTLVEMENVGGKSLRANVAHIYGITLVAETATAANVSTKAGDCN